MSTCTVLLRVPGTEPYLDQLAHLIADHGITAFESDIARLVVRLRVDGHGGPLLAVLADKQVAPVARERALGQLLGQLDTHRPSTLANTAVRRCA